MGRTGSNDLKQAYDYPEYSKKTDGTGVTAAVLMEDLLYPDDVCGGISSREVLLAHRPVTARC